MYPVYDSVDKPPYPKSPSGCVWYLIGFAAFLAFILYLLKWWS